MCVSWQKTRSALKELEEQLKCYICNNILQDPWSVNSCDHSFCRACITKAVNENSKCPECGSFAWLKDLQTNRELLSAVEFCIGLKKAVCSQEQGESLEVNGDSHCNKSKKEQTQDFDSWPLSGTIKKKKSINTYEKRHKHSHRTSDTKQKEADADITKNISSQNAYDDAHIKEIEENFFRDDNEDTGTTGISPSTFVADKETGTKMQPLVKQDVANKASPRLYKRKLPAGKDQQKKGSLVDSKPTKVGASKNHPSVTKVNIRGETPLHVAAIKGKYDRVKELLENDADPNAKDFAGWTPLHEACNHGCLEIVQLLLDYGAFIDIPGCDHDTPLHDAIANNRIEVAEFLISKGASLDIRNKQGLLPMDYVKSTTAKEQLLLAVSMAQENKDANISNASSNILRIDRTLPKCIIHTGLDLKQKKIVERCAAMLKAKVVDQFSDKVTHVITATDDEKLCSRTMKYLLGVLTGKWIVSYDWIAKCLEKHRWLSEEEFEVKGCPGARNEIPLKARINAIKQFPPLFDGCSFYFSGEFHSNPSKAELLDLIKLGGGVLLHREPKAETSHPLITPSSPALMKMMSSKTPESLTVAYHAKPNTAQSYCTQFIIFDSCASPHHKRLGTPILCTAPSSWILDCISKFELVEIKEI